MLVSLLLSLSGASLTDGFVLPAASRLVAASSSSPTFCAGRSGSISGSGVSASAEDQLGSTTVNMDHYDIVKVDLADGRDYPIYIGTEYSDEEGEFMCVCVVAFFLGNIWPAGSLSQYTASPNNVAEWRSGGKSPRNPTTALAATGSLPPSSYSFLEGRKACRCSLVIFG